VVRGVSWGETWWGFVRKERNHGGEEKEDDNNRPNNQRTKHRTITQVQCMAQNHRRGSPNHRRPRNRGKRARIQEIGNRLS